MRIRWYGQSAFLLSGEQTVVIDPFGQIRDDMATRGHLFAYSPMETLRADLLLITHEHFDHNAVDIVTGSPTLIRSTSGTFESPVGEVVAIASEHDNRAGTQRGPNTIFRFSLDGLGVCHLGDLGQAELRTQQQQLIGTIDVLFLPIGGGPTVGGEVAAAIAHVLQPRLVIPMHYRTAAIDFLDPPDTFLDAYDARIEPLPTSEFDANDFLGTREQPTVALPSPPIQP